MSDLVPEDAMRAAHAQYLGNEAGVERAVKAAAPLIRAAELDRLADSLPQSKAARYCEPRVMDVLADELRARASVLRGEGDRDGA